MAKSKETFGKKEKEKQRLKNRKDKLEKMEERKANAKKGKSLDEMMAYVDENGNLSATPPDPRKKTVFKQENIPIGVPKHTAAEEEDIREGIISFFSEAKGYGFIKDSKTKQSVFVHASRLLEPVTENDKVSYETEQTAKGLNAVNVKKSS